MGLIKPKGGYFRARGRCDGLLDSPTKLAEARATDLDRFRRYHGLMLARGLHSPPSPFEAWFVSLPHDEAIVERILEAHRDALTML